MTDEDSVALTDPTICSLEVLTPPTFLLTQSTLEDSSVTVSPTNTPYDENVLTFDLESSEFRFTTPDATVIKLPQETVSATDIVISMKKKIGGLGETPNYATQAVSIVVTVDNLCYASSISSTLQAESVSVHVLAYSSE